MNQADIEYVTPVSNRAWTTRDVLAGATSLATGMSACLLVFAAGPLESNLARLWGGDYVLASHVAFWLATVLGGLLGFAGMFLGVSVVARGAANFGMARLGILVGVAAAVFAASEMTR